MSNKLRVTLACFLAYFVMSGMLAPIGIILPPLAESLGQTVESVAPLFSWLTVGILLGSALALIAFDGMTIRSWMLLLYLLIGAALFALPFLATPWALRLALGAVGCACGIGLAAAAATITQLYSENQRASMLVITDGSFSIAGIVVSSLAVSFVAAGLHWASAYLVVAAIAAGIVLLVLPSRFPPSQHGRRQSHDARAAWPLPVWLCVFALFLFTLRQYSLLWWLPTYLEKELGAPRADAGQVVARFWTGMSIAQVLVAWWVLHIGARRLVLLSVIGSFIGSLPLWNVDKLALLPLLSLLWGIANLGLLKVVIAFATLCIEYPSPRLVAALLFGATSGTAISPRVTSAVVALTDTRTVLQFGSLCYLVLALTMFLACWISAQTPRAATAD